MTNDNRQLDNNSDAFRNLTVPRTNVLDIASHYPYSPVRWRIFVDGNRVFPEYNTVSQYNHASDVHELTPNAGETVAFETTERPRYVVAYELAVTFAFNLNKAGGDLQGDDRLRVGPYDGTDGWFLEHNPTHKADRADFVELDNGTETYRETDVDVLVPLTRFARMKLQTGWYKITRQNWERSYSSDGHQINDTVLNVSSDDNNGPQTGNLPVRFEIRADAATTDLQLDAGSVAQVNLGQTVPLTRDKKTFDTVDVDTADTWQPTIAYRVDPDREIVNVQVEDFTIRELGTGDDAFALLQSFAPENVADANGDPLQDANFDTPNEQTGANSVLEFNPNVDQVVDSTGTLQTTMADPGGIQLQASALYVNGGQNETGEVGPGAKVKRQLTDRDYGVVMVKSGSTGPISYDLQTEQDW
jgi:hypothetical protein